MVAGILYKTLRSIIFSVILVVVGLYVLVYSLVSIPAFTNMVKDKAASRLSALTGGEILIGSLDIFPFNEAKIEDIEAYDPEGHLCIRIDEVGAGISLWKLLTEGRIELSYGEIIGLRADILQEEKDSPLNIQFLIDAFSSKNPEKKENPFEFTLKNVVLRKSSASFRRPWLKDKKIGNLDLSELEINNLAADITFPKISNNGVEVDLRRLSMEIVNAFQVEKIGLKGNFSKERLHVENFIFELPESRILIPQINIELQEGENIASALRRDHLLEINQSYLNPSDFSLLFSPLKQFNRPLPLDLTASGGLSAAKLELSFGADNLLLVSLKGAIENLDDPKKINGYLSDINLVITPEILSVAEESISSLPNEVKTMIPHLGVLEIKADGTASRERGIYNARAQIISQAFSMEMEGEGMRNPQGDWKGEGELKINNMHVSLLYPKIPLENINAVITANVENIGKTPEGSVAFVVENFEYKGTTYDGFSLDISNTGGKVDGELMMHNALADLEAKFSGELEGTEKTSKFDMDLQRLDLSRLIDMKKYDGYLMSGLLNMDAAGSGIKDIEAALNLSNLSFIAPDGNKSLNLKHLDINLQNRESESNLYIDSDWLEVKAEGTGDILKLPLQMENLAHAVFPKFVAPKKAYGLENAADLDFYIKIKHNNTLPEFLNLPVRLLVPVNITGSIMGSMETANLYIDIPYLQQGKDKLIYDTRILADIDAHKGIFDANIETTAPVKRGDLNLNVEIFAENNAFTTEIHWVNTLNPDFKGHLVLDTELTKNHLTNKPEVLLTFLPSVLHMGTAEWNLARSNISYAGNEIKIEGFKIWHDDQFVEIDGVASPEYSDVVKVSLADIDVDYVFDMLQIDYVTFGGTATGEIAGHSLLSGDPVAETESFNIKDFSYNGCKLGDAIVTSKWNNEEKEIEITADIRKKGIRNVYASGGIWLTHDSLCFDIDARRVPTDFVQPFMQAFSSHVGGYASGDVKLYGNFHDIDMTGKIFADSVAIKLDYTNTVYHGSDSVIMTPGKIELPGFRLYDKFGNSALVTGELRHRYFHDPSFNFRLSEARDFLCYDTNQDLNPDWYGVLFGTGSANLTGEPGLVNINADMTITGNSTFTFVLNDTEYARDYQFLTFSDKRKEELKRQQSLLTADDFKEMLRKNMHSDENGLSLFGIDIRATVTPQVLFTLIMDPAAGDKITARGRGAMQVKYESDEDEMMMYGKYEITEGNYNFSLQDIILREFKIKEGSYISFNGNPLAADLDISATYRVNTNLSDLDKSFSTDRDLNRTNVPVDAVLSVTGNMTQPDITFDIELPTLTQDVERKVKSIISTDDMMNRQIIYLLALNRFYTPEYMGSTGNGGELAAVASSTISSQLSNMLGQLTDKFSVAPSFRSDKGDFSDIEVDVALSSRLLNNRLLINGNFGYRDRSNSSTTFVGDFDVEYLLSKNGNLRLKAYNHFNDQNYYLREALTTQGLGVVFRKDFDNWFTFLKKGKKDDKKVEEEEKQDGSQD